MVAGKRPLRSSVCSAASVYCDGILFFDRADAVSVAAAHRRRQQSGQRPTNEPPRAMRSRGSIDALWPDGAPAAGHGRTRCVSSSPGRPPQCARTCPKHYARGRRDGTGDICEDCVNELLIEADRVWRVGNALVRKCDLGSRAEHLAEMDWRFARKLSRAIERSFPEPAMAGDRDDYADLDGDALDAEPQEAHPLAGSDARVSIQEMLELDRVAQIAAEDDAPRDRHAVMAAGSRN